MIIVFRNYIRKLRFVIFESGKYEPILTNNLKQSKIILSLQTRLQTLNGGIACMITIK